MLVHTSSWLANWWTYYRYTLFSMKYPQPGERQMSSNLEFHWWPLRRKLASVERKSWYRYLYQCELSKELEQSVTYTFAVSTCHPGGRFLPSWGHTQQRITSCSSFIATTPCESWPCPARLSCLQCLHSWSITIDELKWSYLSWWNCVKEGDGDSYQQWGHKLFISLHLEGVIKIVGYNVSLQVLILKLLQHFECCNCLEIKRSGQPPTHLQELLAVRLAVIAMTEIYRNFVYSVAMNDCDLSAHMDVTYITHLVAQLDI